MQGQTVNELPKIELIALGSAAETAEDMTAQMGREAAPIASRSWIVNRARSTQLLISTAERLISQQPQNLLHRDRGAEGLIVDAGHDWQEAPLIHRVRRA